MQEIWKDIEGYEGLYQVSNLGRIKGLDRFIGRKWTGQILKPILNGKYYRVSLCKDGRQKIFTIHHLVAKAFVPNPHNHKYIDHIDGNSENNIWTNLRWVSQSDNCNNPNTKYKGRHTEVIQCSLDGMEIKTHKCIRDASRETNICHEGISACCRGIQRTAGGFKWKYAS